MNTVRHPKYGSHQLTLQQLKYSPSGYKNALYKAIAEEYKRDPTCRKKHRSYLRELQKELKDDNNRKSPAVCQ
jgi:hypothetical protein